MSRSSRSGRALAALASTAAAALVAAQAAAQDRFPGLGRAATPGEVAAWDIDVRPDFLGLPKGAGTVAEGEVLWEERCASCHGTFGEANTTFSPLVGGTTAEDVKAGRVANLNRPDYPQRTTLMKVPTVATLFDYVRRAMPWTSPKSLSDDEVYAVMAYMLNLAEIVPADFELNDRTIRDVGALMPNRNGMTTDHGMWPGSGLGNGKGPDVTGEPCMKDCRKEIAVSSRLPDHALPSHGNLAAQMRVVGPVRGMVTGDGEQDFEDAASGPRKVAEEAGCLACHGTSQRIVGPGYAEIALRYRNQDVASVMADRVRNGTEGVWGSVAMPPHPDLSEEDIQALVTWILAGAPDR
jgi:cytochrome c